MGILVRTPTVQDPMLREKPQQTGRRNVNFRGAVIAIIPIMINCSSARRRGGRVAEGGGLLNRYTG